MDNGWASSADAWIADMGEHGDFGRRYVLDPVMLPAAKAHRWRVMAIIYFLVSKAKKEYY